MATLPRRSLSNRCLCRPFPFRVEGLECWNTPKFQRTVPVPVTVIWSMWHSYFQVAEIRCNLSRRSRPAREGCGRVVHRSKFPTWRGAWVAVVSGRRSTVMLAIVIFRCGGRPFADQSSPREGQATLPARPVAAVREEERGHLRSPMGGVDGGRFLSTMFS